LNAAQRIAVAERKALLATRAELDRMRLTAAARDVAAIVSPRRDEASAMRGRGAAALLVGVAAPVLGLPRLARWLRTATLALTAYRILRHWQR
jgi:hypothetical protein